MYAINEMSNGYNLYIIVFIFMMQNIFTDTRVIYASPMGYDAVFCTSNVKQGSSITINLSVFCHLNGVFSLWNLYYKCFIKVTEDKSILF